MSYVIELLGGAVDGRRFQWASLPPVWLTPIAPDLTAFSLDPTPADLIPEVRALRYLPTGRRTPDGAHVYALERKD